MRSPTTVAGMARRLGPLGRGRMPRPETSRLAGTLHVNGGYAKGDFPISLVRAEGSGDVQSSRVTRVLNLAGGVTCTIASGEMERAPAFVFSSARDARAFRGWLLGHLAEIRSAAESAAAGVQLK